MAEFMYYTIISPYVATLIIFTLKKLVNSG